MLWAAGGSVFMWESGGSSTLSRDLYVANDLAFQGTASLLPHTLLSAMGVKRTPHLQSMSCMEVWTPSPRRVPHEMVEGLNLRGWSCILRNYRLGVSGVMGLPSGRASRLRRTTSPPITSHR